MTWLWILIGVVVLSALLSGGKTQQKGTRSKESSHWIYHPHVIEKDDYECSQCHARFNKEAAVCPRCGTRMQGKTVKDEEEWFDEEEELDIIFDDD